jgi:catechol 2,3-dioxygenase-like lactoylglutathione lyase family enzyme
VDPPKAFSGILETAIYCARGEREECERFYSEVLGLPAVARWGDGTSYRVGPGVLLIFDLEKLAGRDDPIAAHGSSGPGHACLLASAGEYERWKERLRTHGVEIVHEHDWREGMRSFYFHDPAGNLLEIASADLWPTASDQ